MKERAAENIPGGGNSICKGLDLTQEACGPPVESGRQRSDRICVCVSKGPVEYYKKAVFEGL